MFAATIYVGVSQLGKSFSACLGLLRAREKRSTADRQRMLLRVSAVQLQVLASITIITIV